MVEREKSVLIQIMKMLDGKFANGGTLEFEFSSGAVEVGDTVSEFVIVMVAIWKKW